MEIDEGYVPTQGEIENYTNLKNNLTEALTNEGGLYIHVLIMKNIILF